MNVMLRDLGSLADFGPADLSDEDYEAIGMRGLCLRFQLGWNPTSRHGAGSESLPKSQKRVEKGKTYFDTADPTPNREKIPELMETVLKTRLVDVLSLNENEAITYAAYLTKEVHRRKEREAS